MVSPLWPSDSVPSVSSSSHSSFATFPLAPPPRRPVLLQIRRQARERREYIYKKAAETQERSIFERKQKMKDALAEGKQLPTELRNDARKMGPDLKFDEAQSGQYSPHAQRLRGVGKVWYGREQCRAVERSEVGRMGAVR